MSVYSYDALVNRKYELDQAGAGLSAKSGLCLLDSVTSRGT